MIDICIITKRSSIHFRFKVACPVFASFPSRLLNPSVPLKMFLRKSLLARCLCWRPDPFPFDDPDVDPMSRPDGSYLSPPPLIDVAAEGCKKAVIPYFLYFSCPRRASRVSCSPILSSSFLDWVAFAFGIL